MFSDIFLFDLKRLKRVHGSVRSLVLENTKSTERNNKIQKVPQEFEVNKLLVKCNKL